MLLIEKIGMDAAIADGHFLGFGLPALRMAIAMA